MALTNRQVALWLTVAAVLGAVLVVLLVARTPRPAIATPAAAPAQLPSVAQTPSPAAVTGWGDGVYSVPFDLPAGTYASTGAREELFTLCTWTVQAPDVDDVRDRLDRLQAGSADAAGEQQLAMLVDGDVLDTSGCEPWVAR